MIDAMSATVRRLEERDRERWLELWARYLRFYRAEIADEVTEETFARLRDQTNGILGLVATDDDDRPVGFAHLVFHPNTWSTVGVCYLEDLYVDPQSRGGGVSRALFDAVFAEAARRGADKTYWHTQAFNGAARSLYDTVGHLSSLIVYEHT
jgi:GNAT superfamily N-acetyltransferase